tara:strand:- start:388 stop:864 length:477 start_codon:yes stop_codon:yes gene_type:complete
MEHINNPKYLIYEDGRVFSKYKNEYKSHQTGRDGYRWVFLHGCGQKNHKIHRLIAIHYIPNPLNLPTVDHINQDKLDNRICNLRWASYETQNHNRTISLTKKNTNNKSGHKYIHYVKQRGRSGRWKYQYGPLKIQKSMKKKRDILCYKFIMIMKHRLH